MSKKKVDLLQFFLRSSPANQHRQICKLPGVKSCVYLPSAFISDQSYVKLFLDGLEFKGVSNSNFSHYRDQQAGDTLFRKMISRNSILKKASIGSSNQPAQLVESIRLVSMQSEDSTIAFQELEQRLEIAPPKLIAESRTKLVYLFKVLLNQRGKIDPSSIQLDANLQVCNAIISALARAQDSLDRVDIWKQLQAMEKLLRAREYQKKGMKQQALNSFEEVFEDQAASAKTRMEALKILCSSWEEKGQTETLQTLASQMKYKGEKEYEELILNTLRRLKSKADNFE